MSTTTMHSRSSRRVWSLLAVAGAAVTALTGCGDDEPSAQEQYCDAGESLQESVASLSDLDLVAEGTDGLQSAVDEVRDDVSALRDTADAAAGDQIDALNQSVEALQSSISDLGGDITADNVAAVADAVSAVATSAQEVDDTLTDC